jgi:hypothetical protein
MQTCAYNPVITRTLSVSLDVSLEVLCSVLSFTVPTIPLDRTNITKSLQFTLGRADRTAWYLTLFRSKFHGLLLVIHFVSFHYVTVQLENN